MNKFLNLDDEKTAVTIIVGGQEFIFKRIVMSVRDKWIEFVKKATTFETEMVELAKSGASGNDMIAEFAKWKSETLLGLLQKILETNNYEYECEWWDNNASYDDVIKILSTVMLKDDNIDENTKKKVTEKQTIIDFA